MTNSVNMFFESYGLSCNYYSAKAVIEKKMAVLQ